MDNLPLSDWCDAGGRPLLIAGPCSAESEAQVLETARRLRAAGVAVDYLRAGVWKARTRPASFEGVGDIALSWLRRAGDEYGLRTATEVATAAHVEAALRHGIDLLWIGARTTTNPFSVQEVASALRGVAVPVLVKNPTSPDVALWIGALERVHAAGIRALGAVHRGFAVSGSTRFRNPPMWELAIELRRQLPQLPMITDPSHITGRREIVGEVAQTALDLGFDGLMIEVHPSPDEAWSDAAQQVTPERLGALMAALHRRRPDADDRNFVTRLEALRAQIDHVDTELLDLLAERMRIVERIAHCKRESNVAALQVTRWQALLDDRVERARQRGLPAEYARVLYMVVHAESVRRQTELMADASGTEATS